ncbi:MAG: DNA cytosine methyltransferase [Shewanella sp.]
MNKLEYIDLFSGCGGLSLGLAKAGIEGLFAIEKDAMAFETLSKNQIEKDSPYYHFRKWPAWLPQTNHNIQEFLKNPDYLCELNNLKGNIPLMAGGPPCQGFSVGGARRGHDERNQLVFDYLEMIKIVSPEMVIIENVEGMARAFKATPGEHERSVLEVVLESLENLGYSAGYFIAKALDAGVPQDRRRVITFAVKKELIGCRNPAVILEREYKKAGREIREELDLPLDRPVTIGEAIDDLSGDEYVECPDSPKFKSAKYLSANSSYQKAMRAKKRKGEVPNSHRFSQHGEKVLALYKNALATQKPGRLSKEFLLKNNTKTQKKFLLGKDIYASTLTTHPDEHIHYKYPRNVSLREMARLQSFPDDYYFYGRYTLNGERRKLDVSRCAQIGNAVPVLMAQALGISLRNIYKILKSKNSDKALEKIETEISKGENLEFPIKKN